MKLKRFEISNQVQYLSESQIKDGLSRNAITKYAYILHDKDVDNDGNLKAPHYHVFVWLKNAYDSKYIAEWFGVAEQYVNRIQSDVSALEYLTHTNAPQKYQYSSDEVISNFDIAKTIDNEKEKMSFNSRLSDILTAIDNGDIREYNIHEHLTIQEYDKYQRHIKNAFEYRVKKIKGANRVMDCVYIVGESGTGKTTYAKTIAEGRGFSYFVSSGSNDVLDDYGGQDCIILDDLRPSALGLADLLKMLDNNTASTVKSRYKNKVLECKMIIITTTLEIDTFFRNVFENDNESAIQLMRRCETHIRFTQDTITLSAWQKKSKCYKAFATIPNPVTAQFAVKDLTPEEALDKFASVLGLASEVVDDMRKNPSEYLPEANEADPDFPFDEYRRA